MRATVDDSCTACGLCEESCPAVFQLGSADKAKVIADPVPEESRECCLEAQQECPVEAIHVED